MANNITLGCIIRNMNPTTTVYIYSSDGECLLAAKRVVSITKDEAFMNKYSRCRVIAVNGARASVSLDIDWRAGQ